MLALALFSRLSLLSLALAVPFQHLPVRDRTPPAYLEGTAPTLFPSESWDHDLSNLENLTPKDSHTLYYTDSGSYDPAVEHLFATIETQYHYLAVATTHTQYIHSISCLDATSLIITFNDKSAYDHVKSKWSLADGHSWVLVTHTSGCFASGDGQNTFWLVSKVEYEGDDRSWKVKLCVEEIAIGHCVSEVEVVWGTHTPVVPGAGSGTIDVGDQPNLPANPSSSSPSNPPSNPIPSKPSPGSAISSGPTSSAPPSGPSSTPSIPNVNNTDCGAFPGSTYLGFPAVPCGEGFDLVLDAQIGYYGFDSTFSADLERFAPGLDDYDPAEYQDDSSSLDSGSVIDLTPTKRDRVLRHLQKRKSIWSKVKKFAKKAVVYVEKKVVPVVKKLVKVLKALDNAGGDYKKSLNFKTGPKKDSDSPWGRQALIYKASNSSADAETTSGYSIGLWCVDCGIESRAVVQGSARFSLVTAQVKSAFVQISGSFGFNVGLGVDAAAYYTATHQETLLSLPIPGTAFTIPGVLVFGGQVSIGVSAFARARAAGRLLISGGISIPNYKARLDAVKVSTSGVTGFNPILKQTFDASGQLDIDIGFGLPIELDFGISLPAIPDFKPKVIGLRDTPEFVANARGVYKNGWQTIDGCTGIPYHIDFHNRLEADGSGKIYPLARQDYPGFVKGCIELAKPPGGIHSKSSSRLSSRSSSRSSYSSYSSYYSPTPSYSSYFSPPYSSAIDSSYYSSAPESSYYSASESSYYSSAVDASYYSSAAESSYYSPAPESRYDSSAVESSYYSSAEPTSVTNYRRSPSRFHRRQDVNIADSLYPEILAFLEDDATLVADTNAALLSISLTQDAQLNPASPDFDGTSYSSILDPSGMFGLVGDDSGVLRLADKDGAAALPWSTFDAITVSDAQDRVLHYYPEQMARFGVSRFRIRNTDFLPWGSEIAAMVPINAEGSTTTPGTLIPTNTAADPFYPISCNLAGQAYSKFFLANSLDGVQTLLRPELRFILTGGVVTDCTVVQFVSSQISGLTG